jgi:hypothetical protein
LDRLPSAFSSLIVRRVQVDGKTPQVQKCSHGASMRSEAAGGQHLVDSSTIEIDDLEAPSIGLDPFACRWQMLKLRQYEAGNSLVSDPRSVMLPRSDSR